MMSGFPAFMQQGGWALFSLIAAVFSMGFYLVNQYLKQPGDLLVFFMRILIVIVLTPFVLHMQLPGDPAFYRLVIVTALLSVTSDIRTLNASSFYGAGVVSRLMPVTVWASFIIWLIMRPEMVDSYFQKPWHAAGIVASMLACVYFASRLRHEEVTRSAMKMMMLPLIGYTLVTIFSKMAMEHGIVANRFAGAAIGYMYVQSLTAVILLGPYILWKRRGHINIRLNRMTVLASLIACFVWISHMVYKNFAIAYTPHPSYQAAINLLTPVFIALFYKLVKHKESKTDMVAGMGIVAATIFLTLMTL